MRASVPVLAALLLLAPAASADPLLDSAALLAQSAEDAAFAIAGTAAGSAASVLGFAGGLGGPAGGVVASAGEAFQGALHQGEGEFFAAGKGPVSMVVGGRGGACPDTLALVNVHEPASNEPALTANFGPSQGNPALVCGSGWRFTFKPTEVRGDEAQGWHAYRISPDAEIWLTLGPEQPDGSRALDVRHITVFGDVLEFHGRVTQFA